MAPHPDDFDPANPFGNDPAPRPSAPAPRPTGGDVFDLADPEPHVDDSAAPAPPIPDAPAVKRPRPRPAEPDDEGRTTRRAVDESAKVEQVWSRGAEWGASIALLAVAGLGVAFLVYSTFNVNYLSFSFLILMVGGAFWIVLCYPIVITLERPVRITPEQALKDYYGALSHHLPHYRRMWLLLSSAGRTSAMYGSFEGFKGYWKGRLRELRQAAGASGTTPLVFEIDEFKSDKSAGQTHLNGKFRVNVYVRGKRSDGPVESVRIESGFVRGPDQMWYLNNGTLPAGKD